MTLNELRDESFAYAERQGFHEKPVNLGERLMLITSELSEALEADRKGKWTCERTSLTRRECDLFRMGMLDYEQFVKGTVEEEIADAFIRLGDLAGIYNIDLESHVKAKMAYNKTRPYGHGKKYG